MAEKDLNDVLFDTLIKDALLIKGGRDFDALPSEEECAKLCQYSERHERRMKKLFAKDRRQEVMAKAKVILRRTAAAILILISLLFAALYTLSPEVRAAVNQTVLTWTEIFVRSEPNFDTPAGTVDLEAYELSYIPEGFALTQDINDELGCLYMFESADKMITVQIYEKSADVLFDNEHGEYRIITADENEYHLFDATSTGEDSIVFWENEEAKFLISSNLPDAEELLKIAGSIKK